MLRQFLQEFLLGLFQRFLQEVFAEFPQELIEGFLQKKNLSRGSYSDFSSITSGIVPAIPLEIPQEFLLRMLQEPL